MIEQVIDKLREYIKNEGPNVEVSLKPVVGAIEGFLSAIEACKYSSKIKGG